MAYYFKNLEHLYIHWPFCPYKCNFCDFVAIASHESFMQQYHESLCKEIRDFKKSFDAQGPLKTLYIGGGTPSTYPLPSLREMFGVLREVVSFDEKTEVTFEVNPGTVEDGALELWKELGINRLSIGVQSLKDTVLQGLNRHQTKIDVINLLQKTEPLFKNVSVDFIVGLPGVSSEEWKSMILEAMSWPITHISVYFLMVHEKTPLYFKIKQKSVVLPPDDEIIDLYYWTVDILERHEFYRYELSNFAKKGFESKHNQAYWERKGYKGLGLGACSFNGQFRFQNNKNLRNYFEAVAGEQGLIYESEEISLQQISTEKIMLGLRQAKGVDIENILQDFTPEQQQQFKEKAEWLEMQGFVRQGDGRLYLTPRGFVVENEVAVNLFPE
ncbi:radical SAM family heme chaperone HemW [Candidatus Babeliales bacterium]|nr:radical SAM family heme chaperone HemW [Candidatus Babeliales bacterium]MBP9843550.1 radical SAM family heme chaperone HemW [Candidatus Babeliales bacterium]